VSGESGLTYSVYVNFLTWEFRRCSRTSRCWIGWRQTPALSDHDKSLIAYDLANMLYRAPDRDACKRVCDWIVKQYPNEAEGSARALILLGNLRRVAAGDFDGAEPYFRQLAEKYGDLDLVPATFWVWAGTTSATATPPRPRRCWTSADPLAQERVVASDA